MDSTSHAAVDDGGGRSGGKILKKRKIAARNTPYDRPTPPPQPENSNWLNGLVFPAKFVAGGATKLLSSLWKPKTWGSRSSSSDSDSDSEVGVEDEYVRDVNILDAVGELNQNNGSSSGKSEILYLIEQLITLEHFSREECDRLIGIINSRAVDYTQAIDDAPQNPDISNKAIMEARKLISENIAGTSSKSDLDNNNHSSKALATQNRDHVSGGSRDIQNEMQRLHSKVIELMKPEPMSSEAPKSGNETVNLASNDMKNIQDDAPTEALSSLPTIEEQNPIAEENDVKDDKTHDAANLDEGSHDLITEYAEVTDVINVSQGSSNTSDPTPTKAAVIPSVRRPVTRTRRYNTRRGRARGK